MLFSYYIYYRVGRSAQAASVVRSLLDSVKARTGIDGRLLAGRDDPATWMEIYEGVADAAAFESALAACVAASGFDAVLEPGGRRHTECFTEPCA